MALVEMMAAATRGFEQDIDVEIVVCSRLSRAMGADAGVCGSLDADPSGSGLACYPDGVSAAGLAGLVRGRLPAAMDHGPLVLHDSELGTILVVFPRLLSLGPQPVTGRRALAFAKLAGFAAEDEQLLREAIAPLVALLPHAVAAAESRERAAAAQHAARTLGLTARELQVLELLSQGLLATSIASRLSLSPRTVHKHLGNIYEKLGVHDRLVAVSLARGHGLVAA